MNLQEYYPISHNFKKLDAALTCYVDRLKARVFEGMPNATAEERAHAFELVIANECWTSRVLEEKLGEAPKVQVVDLLKLVNDCRHVAVSKIPMAERLALEYAANFLVP
jgi:hypothetical protein